MSINVTRLDEVVYVNTTADGTIYVTKISNNEGNPAIQFQDEGANIGTAGAVSVMDFVGANVSLALVGGKLTVTITGGSGGGSGDVTGPASSTDSAIVLFDGLTGKIIKDSTKVLSTVGGNIAALTNPSAIRALRINADNTVTAVIASELIGIACSDETTVLAAASTTVPVATFHAPYAMTLTRVYSGLRTAGTGAAVVTVDIHVNGTTIMSTTKILFTASQKLSADGTLTTTSIVAGDYVEIFLDQRDTNNMATGLKTYLVGYK